MSIATASPSSSIFSEGKLERVAYLYCSALGLYGYVPHDFHVLTTLSRCILQLSSFILQSNVDQLVRTTSLTMCRNNCLTS